MIVVRWHVCKSKGNGGRCLCLSSSLSLSVGFFIQDEALDPGGPLICGRYLLASLTGNKERAKRLMVLRVKPTPNRFPTNSLHIPMDNTPLHSMASVCHPWGEGLLWAGHITSSGLLMGSSSACWRVAVEGCVGLTEVLGAGVVAKTWVGLGISG